MKRFARILRSFPVTWAIGLVPSLSLQPLAMTEIPASLRVEGTRVGGLSGLAWGPEKTVFLSDDRGKFGAPRVYETRVQYDGKKLALTNWSVIPLRKVPSVQGRPAPLDPEGLARLAEGDLLISSEADTNLKPRAQNRILRFKPDGQWKSELVLSNDIQPELAGRQLRGSKNNLGPEGLSLTPDGEFLWIALESSLVQETRPRLIRLERFQKKDGSFHSERLRHYEVEAASSEAGEIFRGVSSVLAISSDRLLVLERSAVLNRNGISYGGGIFVADCAPDICTKKLVLDFAKDLTAFRGGKNIPNFEGLSWGPETSEAGRTIFLLSDNNFSVNSGTELLLLSFKDSP